jgi:hypothetical protein
MAINFSLTQSDSKNKKIKKQSDSFNFFIGKFA